MNAIQVPAAPIAPWTREEMFLTIADRIRKLDLPVPALISFHSAAACTIRLDTIAEFDEWAMHLTAHGRKEQVYRMASGRPVRLVTVSGRLGGQWLSLTAYDPATPAEITVLEAREAADREPVTA